MKVGARPGVLFAWTTALIVVAVVGTFLLRFSPAELAPLAASPYGLEIITWASLAILPLVLAYQAWSYRVLHKRLSHRKFVA